MTEDYKNYKDIRKIRYLSQSFIEKKCHPEQADELQKDIEDIIFQHIQIQDRMEQTTFYDLKKLKTQSNEVKKVNCRKLLMMRYFF